MTVREMDYDAMEYKCQISRMNRNHKKEEISGLLEFSQKTASQRILEKVLECSR